MTTGAICGPAMAEISRTPNGNRFCFVCRKRVEFELVMQAPVELSYYGPNVYVECQRGHYDGDCFPGTSRVWDGEGE